MYMVRFASGGMTRYYDSYDIAVSMLQEEYPDCVIGHDGDILDGGYQTLVWENESDSIDDSGLHSLAMITEVESFKHYSLD